MTIRKMLQDNFQKHFEKRIEMAGEARAAGDTREEKRNFGFVFALNEALRVVDALQDTDQSFAGIYTILFAGFKERARAEEEMARACDQEHDHLGSATYWGRMSGYTIIALMFQEQGDKYVEQHKNDK